MIRLPEGFLKEIEPYPALAGLPDALQSEPSVSIRINTLKVPVPPDADLVPWCAEGVYLPRRERFTFDPSLHQGAYYVQDASSMAVSTAAAYVADGRDVRYLDICAAPGGKTLGALSALSPASLVVANEYDFRRAEILAENVAKWGRDNVVVSRGDTSRYKALVGMFDIVAVDAPCSGEGMMRKDEQAVRQWSPALVQQCAALQREILANAWTALRPGGHLIYSTCTFNTVENEDNAAWLAEKFAAVPVSIPALDAAPGVVRQVKGTLPCYRFVPGMVRGEGLFMCVMQKPVDSSVPSARVDKKSGRKDVKSLPAGCDVSKWLAPGQVAIVRENEIYAVPKIHAPFIDTLLKNLDVISAGVHTATLKGRDLIPAHPLALSAKLKYDTFPRVEVDVDTAVKYLQRDTISLPEATPRGYVLLTWQGRGLGFVKNLGSRCNNLYPKNWRILSRN